LTSKRRARLLKRLSDGLAANRITQILHGKRSVSGDTALRLGHWFGTSAQFWLNLQTAYDIRIAEKMTGAEIRRLPKRA
jgi:addiction module HigA family antidote